MLKTALSLVFAAACALLALDHAVAPAAAQSGTRAYAPENLYALTVAERVRVIEREYADQSGGRQIPDDQLDFYLDMIQTSRWPFSRVRDDIATSLRGSGGWTPGGGWNATTLICSSNDRRYRECPTPFHGRVRIVEQLSSTRCTEGQNWGSRPGLVWVDGGCRARFGEVQGSAWGGSQTMRCESTDNRPHVCRTPWPQRSTLVRQLSNTQCVEGRNWSSTPGSVWVNNGCRAEFAPQGADVGTELRCESTDNRYRQCGNDLHGRAVLVRQLSETRCVEGQNWGLRNGRLWVDRGCRGIFRVGDGHGSGYDYNVTCASQNSQYTTCYWDRSRGLPQLIEQLSSAACTRDRSWGYDERYGLWVDRGCRARFGTRR
jgi:hypothetical protein